MGVELLRLAVAPSYLAFIVFPFRLNGHSVLALPWRILITPLCLAIALPFLRESVGLIAGMWIGCWAIARTLQARAG